MYRQIRNTGLILMLLVSVFCAACSDADEAEYEEPNSGWFGYQETESGDDEYDTESGFADSSEETWDDEDSSEHGNEVYIPADTGVVRYTGDTEQLRWDMYWETSQLKPDVCLIGGSFDRNDIYAMPYSGFWIRDYSTRTESGRDSQTGETVTHTFYHFIYDDGLTVSDLDSRKAEIDSAANGIISMIPVSADTWTQITIVHDELCRQITFDKDDSNLHRYDTYGALVNREAVCNGYACAFNHIMSKLGIESKRLYSHDHAWSVVNIDSAQKYLDITWDDTDMYDKYGNEYVNHSYLFLTQDEMELIPQHQNVSADTIPMTYGADYANFHMHEGYYMYDCSWDELVRIMRQQYDSGMNMLTVRFTYWDDYENAKQWDSADRPELYDLMNAIGYTGGYYTWFNDDVRTMTIGLYAEPQ